MISYSTPAIQIKILNQDSFAWKAFFPHWILIRRSTNYNYEEKQYKYLKNVFKAKNSCFAEELLAFKKKK